jgi:anthranilate synthase component 1
MRAFATVREAARPYAAAWVTYPVDQESPITAFLKLRALGAHTLLESVAGDEKVARFSFIAVGRLAELVEEGGEAVLRGEAGTVAGPDPVALLRAGRDAYRAPVPPGHLALPYSGGPLGFFAYDWVRRLERLPSRHPRVAPEWYWTWPHTVLAFDHRHRSLTIIAQARPDEGEAFLRGRLQAAVDALHQPFRPLDTPARRTGPVRANLTETAYGEMVERARAYIRAGDIFQVVPSQKLSAPVSGDPFGLYRRLRRLNPSPYLFYLETPALTLVGASPESLVRVQDGRVETRPIAGTRPRGRTPEEDEQLWEDLRQDEKEQAEHVMLVDLGRNDLGRVSLPGSVVVKALMIREQYSHVMHLVSVVEGRLDPSRDALDALMACFPAGTLTGAPKIRAMEIIDELEPERRGAYGGIVGYWSHQGALDTAITIRTLEIAEGLATVQAGGGVVADSQPEREYQESLNKARALLAVLEQEEEWL